MSPLTCLPSAKPPDGKGENFMQKRVWMWCAVTMIVLALPSVSWSAVAGEKQAPAEKVAVVNGSIITTAEFDQELKRTKQAHFMGKPISLSMLPKVKEKALESLIERELLYQESQKKGIKIDEAVVDDRLFMLRKRFPGEDEFKKELDKMGLSEALLKNQFRRSLATKQLFASELSEKVEVTDKEIKDYYDSNPGLFKQPEQVKASHILISTSPDADESQKAEARKKLQEIEQRLKKGEDFSALAKEVSQCPSSARGGDLGYFGRGRMAKPFEEAAFALKPGEVSSIVKTQFGYHLVKAADRKPEGTMALKDVKGRLEQRLKQQKAREEMSKYVSGLKSKAKVERFMPKGE
jgi:peptidyl-prolyl cis-trans isomerase C